MTKTEFNEAVIATLTNIAKGSEYHPEDVMVKVLSAAETLYEFSRNLPPFTKEN